MRIKGLCLSILVLAMFVCMAGCRKKEGLSSAGAAERRDDKVEEQITKEMSMEEKFGIKVESISLTSAGYMLDFRYRVIDPNRSIPVFSRAYKPYIVDKASGAKFIVPSPAKVGPMRQTTLRPDPDKVYFMFFVNPGKFIKSGSKVDVVIGDFVAEDIVVK